MAPRLPHLIALLIAAVLAISGCGGNESPGPGGVDRAGDEFDAARAFEDLERQVALGPRPAGSAANRRQARLLARELRAAGLAEVEILGGPRTVVGLIEGTEPGYVVVGAHHDTKDIPGFVGANDGASGVAVVLELARALPRPIPGRSIAVALFDAEEARGDRSFDRDGTRGSQAYVDLAGSEPRGAIPPLDEIAAMVLFDLVGDCDLGIPREQNSDPALYRRFSEQDPELFAGETGPIADDHIPFIEAGIPAVDLIDFSYGPGGSPGAFWHTNEDTLDKVCPESLDRVGEASLIAIEAIAAGGVAGPAGASRRT